MRCSEPGESLAAPQLLRSNVWAIVPLVMKGPTTVFLHRGLSPHQFTPMSGAHKADAPNPAMTCLFQIRSRWRGVGDLRR